MQYATIPPENFGPHLHIETNPVAENGHTWTNLLAENLNQWSIVFIVFLIELGLCSSIIFPVSLNLRSQLIYNLARLWDHNHRFRLVIKTLMVGGFHAANLASYSVEICVAILSHSVHHGLLLL